jgi:hypothetical protein
VQPLEPGANGPTIIVKVIESRGGIDANLASKPRRHAEDHIVCQQRSPFIEAPMIQEQGFAKQEVLDIVVDTRGDGKRQIGVRKNS